MLRINEVQFFEESATINSDKNKKRFIFQFQRYIFNDFYKFKTKDEVVDCRDERGIERKSNRIFLFLTDKKKTHENENETIYKRKLVNSNMRRYDDNVHQL